MDSALTPEMVQDVRFARARHGYRVEDVDDFLVKVADGILVMQAETAALRSRLDELEAELPASRAQHVLAAATSIADTLLAEATREASVLAAERQRRVDSTAGALARATEACDKALELVDDLRGELAAAGEAFRPLAEEDVPAPDTGAGGGAGATEGMGGPAGPVGLEPEPAGAASSPTDADRS